jgi:hypothetical protein
MGHELLQARPGEGLADHALSALVYAVPVKAPLGQIDPNDLHDTLVVGMLFHGSAPLSRLM